VCRGPRTPQILVIDVSEHLVVGICVDGRHQTVDEPDFVVQRLDQRHQAVGRAGGVRNHRKRGFQRLVVDPKDDRRIDVLATGRGNDHFLRAALDVRGRLFLGREEPRAFMHDIDAEFAPRQFGRVAIGQHTYPVAIDDHRIAVDRDGARKRPMSGVMLGQMRVGLRVAKIVDRDDLDVMTLAAFVVSTQDVAADPAVAVDCDFDRHFLFPFL
jgi:hypothetical protein